MTKCKSLASLINDAQCLNDTCNTDTAVTVILPFIKI